MPYIKIVFLLLGLLFSDSAIANDASSPFSRFEVNLPPGWSGDETTGFISDNPQEYMLVLTKLNNEQNAVAAQVTIYILPNKPQKNAEESARVLAEAQGESSEPIKDGNLWTFTGEPRTRTIKGKGQTWVNANERNLLIIMTQDPENLGSEEIVRSLKGKSEDAVELLR